jgi:hypothetical protein
MIAWSAGPDPAPFLFKLFGTRLAGSFPSVETLTPSVPLVLLVVPSIAIASALQITRGRPSEAATTNRQQKRA